MTDQLLYEIAFANLLGINDKQRKELLLLFDNAKNIYTACQKGDLVLKDQWQLSIAEKEIEFINKHQINAISFLNNQYPNRLKHCDDGPTMLYHKGSTEFNLPRLLSIVGTRKITIQVQKVIQELLEGIKHLNLGIISGLAVGTDGIAHATAVKMGIPTWGILAHGLDTIYPTQHRKLAIAMMQHGGLITEFTKGTPTLPFHFPKRNRIVAGMSDVTIVIESEIKGGSMITANLANGYDRDLFAVPGRIHDNKSKGCLKLISEHKAQLYMNPVHLLEQLNWEQAPKPELLPLVVKNEAPMSPIIKELLLYIKSQGPVHRDQITMQFNLNNGELSSHLLHLEMLGLIQMQAGNRFVRR